MKLAIDTSFKEVSVALESSGGISVKSKFAPMKQSEVLSQLLIELMEETKQSLSSITEILVSAGPGSFTGLRVSYAWAKGFATTHGCSISQISYFDEILNQGNFIMESGKDRFQIYELATKDKPSLLTLEELKRSSFNKIFSPYPDLIPINSAPLGIIAKLLFTGVVIKKASSYQEISDLAPAYGHKAPFLTIQDRKKSVSI